MNREELKQYLPHRDPMLLVDEIKVEEDGSCTAIYHIKEDEFFCQGHFPGNPLVPGVILCEIMAQSCALLAKDELKGKTTLYSGIDKARFKHPVRPGDVCHVHSRLIDRRGNIFFCDSVVYVDGILCCKGSLSFALA